MDKVWTLGERINVRDAGGHLLAKRVLDPTARGHNFPVVWACSEAEWAEAQAEGRDPVGLAWPVEDVAVEDGAPV